MQIKRLFAVILAVGVLMAGCTARPVGSTPAVAGTLALTATPSETLPPVLIPVSPTATLPKSPTPTPIEVNGFLRINPHRRAHPGCIPREE